MEQILRPGGEETTREITVTYTVTFMDGDAELSELAQTVTHGEKASRPSPDPGKDGFTFNNWFADSGLTTPFKFETPITVDTIVYAKYFPVGVTLHTVTFMDGDEELYTVEVESGEPVSRPMINPTKSGHTFVNWYRDPALTDEYDFDSPVGEDITLYAQWTENTAIITITVEQMTDLSFDDIPGGIIYRNGSPKSIIFPSSISFEYMGTGAYTCEWTIDGVGAYAGLIQLSDDSSCTVDAKDPQYNSTGKHAVYLSVEKDGVPYKKTIWVTIEDGVPVAATGVTLDKTTLTLAVGDPLTGILTATVEPDDSTNQNVTWTTSDDSIASISNGTATSGVVTAVSGGSVIITVTTADGGHTATCAVTVTQPVTGVTLSPKTLFLTIGGTETLTATVAPSNATNKAVTWEPSNTGVATVNSNGLVSAQGLGTATITVRTANGNHTETCTVTVTAPTAIDDEDFDPGAAIRIFYVYNEDDWKVAKTAISGGGNNKNYVINVMDDFTVTGATTTTFGSTSNIKVSLRGDRTLTLTGIGNLIRGGAGQTVILRGLTLQGNSGNGLPLVNMSGANSVFVMRSGEISGNTSYSTSGGGVSVVTNAAFTMYGGAISGNTCNGSGGGVYVNSGTFTMHGGTISGNTANGTSNNQGGGGVWMNSGTIRIVTGTIYGNTEAEGIRNTANLGAALYHNGGTAQRGTFSGTGGTWVSSGNLAITEDTINVEEGVLQ